VTTYSNYGDRHEGDFLQVASVEVKVKDALEQGLLDQITDHVGDCSDSNPRERGKLTAMGMGSQDVSRCPRCTLLFASTPQASGYLLDSPLKLRVIVQIKHMTPFDYIRWD
jgi:hypothetical protein